MESVLKGGERMAVDKKIIKPKPLMKLRLFRVEKEMTIEQFADAIGYERKHYSNIEKGLVNPTTRLLSALCDGFEMTVDEAWELVKNN